MQPAPQVPASTPTLTDHLRALGAVACLACGAAALYPFPGYTVAKPEQWRLLLAAFVLSIVWQLGVRLPAASPGSGAVRGGRARRLVGCALALSGAALVAWGGQQIYVDWRGHFDRAWLSWLSGAVLLGVGLDLAWGRWPRPPRSGFRRAVGVLAGLLVVGAAYRLYGIAAFPGPAGVTQIEDLQFGDWGWRYLQGERWRWEFIGMAWIAALGESVGGFSLAAMRSAYAVTGTLVIAALFAWLRSSAGMVAALVGSAFLAVSSWDAVVARIGFNPDALVIAAVFALLVGPLRRGRPSAYVALGFLCGYILWEYIGYRPLAFFAPAAALFYSLRDRSVSLPLRWLRPALVVAMMACMTAALFGVRLRDRFDLEYLNGINRARAVSSYYNENYTWEQYALLRGRRALSTIGLFFFAGDGAPTRNVGNRPLVDAASAMAMLIGFGFCVAHPRTEIFGWIAAAFVSTTVGAMIVTADFNALRMSVTMPYLYLFAGLAGGAIYAVWSRAWGSFGRVLALLVLAAAVAWSAYDNTRFLLSYWGSPEVKRAVRNNLAFLSSWLGENVRAEEQVIGAAAREANALEVNDGQWLRGREMAGALEWDIESALRAWNEDVPTVFVLFAGEDTLRTKEFLEELFPGLDLRFVKDPIGRGGDIAYQHLEGRPAGLDEALASFGCRGVAVDYIYRGPAREELRRVRRVAPMVGRATWPTEVEQWFHRAAPPARLEVLYRARISIERGGEYRFTFFSYGGVATIRVGGRIVASGRTVELPPGVHEIDARVDFAPLAGELRARFLWKGPDTGDVDELIPFYRIAEIDPACGGASAAAETSPDSVDAAVLP